MLPKPKMSTAITGVRKSLISRVSYEIFKLTDIRPSDDVRIVWLILIWNSSPHPSQLVTYNSICILKRHPRNVSGNRGPLNVTIVQVGGGNGSGVGSDLLGLEPPAELKPSPSPISETSATLQSDNNDTFTSGNDNFTYELNICWKCFATVTSESRKAWAVFSRI